MNSRICHLCCVMPSVMALDIFQLALKCIASATRSLEVFKPYIGVPNLAVCLRSHAPHFH
ncbi:MAG: hypothetical protein JXB47_15970 [Anaerolineae bacterium]|nr:hypothetical protein [Anaerolineae bacterium]